MEKADFEEDRLVILDDNAVVSAFLNSSFLFIVS